MLQSKELADSDIFIFGKREELRIFRAQRLLIPFVSPKEARLANLNLDIREGFEAVQQFQNVSSPKRSFRSMVGELAI